MSENLRTRFQPSVSPQENTCRILTNSLWYLWHRIENIKPTPTCSKGNTDKFLAINCNNLFHKHLYLNLKTSGSVKKHNISNHDPSKFSFYLHICVYLVHCPKPPPQQQIFGSIKRHHRLHESRSSQEESGISNLDPARFTGTKRMFFVVVVVVLVLLLFLVGGGAVVVDVVVVGKGKVCISLSPSVHE